MTVTKLPIGDADEEMENCNHDRIEMHAMAFVFLVLNPSRASRPSAQNVIHESLIKYATWGPDLLTHAKDIDKWKPADFFLIFPA
jgi:hypothetical protein